MMEFVDEYSEELICIMLLTLEPDENKRKNSSQLLKYVDECIDMKFPPSSRFDAEGDGVADGDLGF